MLTLGLLWVRFVPFPLQPLCTGLVVPCSVLACLAFPAAAPVEPVGSSPKPAHLDHKDDVFLDAELQMKVKMPLRIPTVDQRFRNGTKTTSQVSPGEYNTIEQKNSIKPREPEIEVTVVGKLCLRSMMAASAVHSPPAFLSLLACYSQFYIRACFQTTTTDACTNIYSNTVVPKQLFQLLWISCGDDYE